MDELSGHNVRKIGASDGEVTQIGNVRVTWKARGKDTGFQFGVMESELRPQTGVPLHKHPFAEWICVLEGTLMFARLSESEQQEWISCNAGESILAPPNAPHGVMNQSDRLARFLSVSNYHHEVTLTEGGRFVHRDDPIPETPDPSDLERFQQVANKYQGFFVTTE
jgi:quercetin dioxygenase-like cupin family protein